MTDTQPTWQPVSMLLTIAQLINKNLDETLVQLKDFKEAEHRPQIFTDEIINRALKIYSAQLEDHWLFERQLELWSNDKILAMDNAELGLTVLLGEIPSSFQR